MNATLPLLAAALLLPEPPGPSSTGDGPYRRVVHGAVERAQAALVKATDLWEDHSVWERAWQIDSRYYAVRTTESRYLAQDIGAGLDSMVGHFRRILGTEYEPPEKLPIFVLPDLAAYNDFGNQHGAEHSSFYGSFFPNAHPERPVACMFDRNPTLLRMWLTHSAVHQFLDRAYTRQAPTWMSEGLASYFALYWDGAYGVNELKRILATASTEPAAPDGGPLLDAVGRLFGNEGGAPAAEYVPLSELLDAGLPAYTERAHSRLIELGMLFTYLLHYREDTRIVEEDGVIVRAPFAEYLREFLEGRDVTNHPVTELLGEGRAALEADFRAYYGG